MYQSYKKIHAPIFHSRHKKSYYSLVFHHNERLHTSKTNWINQSGSPARMNHSLLSSPYSLSILLTLRSDYNDFYSQTVQCISGVMLLSVNPPRCGTVCHITTALEGSLCLQKPFEMCEGVHWELGTAKDLLHMWNSMHGPLDQSACFYTLIKYNHFTVHLNSPCCCLAKMPLSLTPSYTVCKSEYSHKVKWNTSC